jgi:HEAT repeat protein
VSRLVLTVGSLLLAMTGPPAAVGQASGPAAGDRGPERTVREVALDWLSRAESGGSAEDRKTLRVALEMAGPELRPQIARLLDDWSVMGRGAVAAWALGLVAGPVTPSPAPDDPVVSALVRALSSPSWDVRLAAASSLGALGAPRAISGLHDLLHARDRPDGTEEVLLLALAGAGADTRPVLEPYLLRGGGTAWSSATTAIFLRRGRESWPVLCDALDHGDATVRGTAATTLLLLAAPRSACRIAEAYGNEPEPPLRRVLLQALAATAQPQARDQLGRIAASEPDEELREAARWLAEAMDRADAAPRSAPGSRSMRELLEDLARPLVSERAVRELELRADVSDVEDMDRALRWLPLREDDAWRTLHAHLAQLRARLTPS